MTASYTYQTTKPNVYLSIVLPHDVLTEKDQQYIGAALNIINDRINKSMDNYKSTIHPQLVERWFS